MSEYVFEYAESERECFRDGDLVEIWYDAYPQIFDEDDARKLQTRMQRNYHYFEWLTAIRLFESYGYLSLVEECVAKSHRRKRAKVEELVPEQLFNWMTNNTSGQPDLFVYNPADSDWFFCEVKGPNDKIRANQLAWERGCRDVLQSLKIECRGRFALAKVIQAGDAS